MKALPNAAIAKAARRGRKSALHEPLPSLRLINASLCLRFKCLDGVSSEILALIILFRLLDIDMSQIVKIDRYNQTFKDRDKP